MFWPCTLSPMDVMPRARASASARSIAARPYPRPRHAGSISMSYTQAISASSGPGTASQSVPTGSSPASTRNTSCPGESSPAGNTRSVSRRAFSLASSGDMAPEAAMSSAYPASCPGSQSSNSAGVAGRKRSTLSVIGSI